MHICYLMSMPFPPEDGIGSYVYGLSKKMVEKGHKVTIITRGSWKGTRRQVIGGIDVIKVRFVPIYPFYIDIHGIFVNRIFKTLEPNIDIVHVHSPLSPIIETLLPIVTTIHTPMLTDHDNGVKITSIYSLLSKISARFVSYRLELELIKNSDMVTTVSVPIAQELEKNYHLDIEKTNVIDNGVDENLFVPSDPVGNRTKYIMYAGHITREKGLFDLVECGKYICDQNSDVTFILAGKGSDIEELRQSAKRLGLQNRFIFLGHITKDKLVKLYQDSTLFVFPSYHEGLPTAILEAMSCGLPVVATNVRGNRELIIDKKNGILVQPRSPKEMADAISRLLDDGIMRKFLGNNARKTIEERYTWDVISNKILLHYNDLIRRR